MINYVMVGTNRFEEAVEFYDALMTDMGAVQVYATERSDMLQERLSNMTQKLLWASC